MIWHSASLENIAAELQTDLEQGLTPQQAEDRLDEVGYNLLSNESVPTLGQLLATQLKKGWTVALLVCAVILFLISMVLGGQGWHIPLVMACILVLHSLFNAWQLQHSAQAVEQLKIATAPTARVIRGGQEQTISAAELVPGDLLVLAEGDHIPADARLIWGDALRCDEALLTGETVPTEKMSTAQIEDIAGIKQRVNMVYSGCPVLSGSARAVVTETGNETEWGRRECIAGLEQEEASPLAQHFAKVGRLLGICVPVFCGLLVLVGLIVAAVQNADLTAGLFDSFVLGASLAATVLPLELAGVLSVVLALGIARFGEQKAIVKNPATAEVLAQTTVLCTDKTGILTQRRMSAVRVYDGNELYDLTGGALSGSVSTVLRLGAICCDATADLQQGQEVRSGDDTEAALVSATLRYLHLGSSELSNTYPRLGCVPFTPERMCMTTVNMIDGRVYAIVKGAPEAVLPLCLQNTESAEKVAQGMAEDALRVLAVAVKLLDEAPAIPTAEELEQNLTFVGLVGLMDPPRKEAYEAIRVCRSAGIRVVMVTGDHSATAAAVAKKLGICPADGRLLTGEEMDAMTDEELAEAATECNVYARVAAEQKGRILAALGQEGQTLTATGKTVGDAYALQQANVSVAVGSAANITRATADVVLQSDNFNAVVLSVFNSRGLFANVKKILRYALTCAVAAALTALLGLCIFGTAPVTALQYLYLHMILAAMPAFALGFEPPEPELMAQPPQGKQAPLVTKNLLIDIAWQGALLAVTALVAFGLGGNATAFAVLAVGELLLALSLHCRGSVIGRKFIANPVLLYCVGCALVMAVLFAGTPLSGLLGIGGSLRWLWLLLALVPFAAAEIYKWVKPLITKK